MTTPDKKWNVKELEGFVSIENEVESIAHVFGYDPETALSRADIFAAAPETAKERDRLKVLNEESIQALNYALNNTVSAFDSTAALEALLEKLSKARSK